jgi:hypothetical protein
MTSKGAWMACGSLALLLAAQGPAHAHDYTFQVVATLGDPAPGGGNHEGDFEPEDINNRGSVLFASDLSQPGEGLFLRRSGKTSQITRTGRPAPGTGTTFGTTILSIAGMNDAGDIAFGFLLEPSTPVFGVSGGVFRYTAATKTVTPVIVPGDKDADGTTFVGSFFHSDINNAGVVAASMIIETDQGRCQQGTPCEGWGHAVYTVSRQNQIRKVAAPGDPAPGEKKFFDEAVDSNINDRGDVVFGGHVKGEVCLGEDPKIPISCFESLYLYTASTGEIQSIAHTGDPAPRGGHFAIAFMGMPNNSGDIAFIGTTNTLDPLANTGVYLWRGQSGVMEAVAIQGDALPGGGSMTRATPSGCCVDVNKAVEVAFAAQLDTDVDEDGIKDTGVFVKLGGSLRKVVRTGDVLPGIGTVQHVNLTFAVPADFPAPFVNLNDSGQVLTQVILDDGTNHVVVATPL